MSSSSPFAQNLSRSGNCRIDGPTLSDLRECAGIDGGARRGDPVGIPCP